MKKILIVNDGFPPHSWGGANTIAFLHAKGLRERGFDVKVFSTAQDRQTKIGWSEFEGIPVRTFYTNYHPRWWAYKSLNNKEIVGEFKKELKAFAPDVVHFHNIHHYFSYRTITIAKDFGASVFLTAHDVMSFSYQKLHHFIDYTSTAIPTSFNYYVPWQVNARDAKRRYNPFRNFVIRNYLKKVDQLFAVSTALKQALSDNGIKGNVSVVHNGINASSFGQYFDQDSLKERLGLTNAKVILFVGRFTPDKGRDVTLKAFAEVLQKVSTAKLLVIGYDPKLQSEPVMEKLIDELQVRDRIVFVGSSPYTEIYKYYRIADCVVVPSVIFDSFPTVNLEAMAAGKPVVATCFGGSREAVEDGATGFVVNPLDTQDFAKKVTVLLQDEEKAKQMGERGLVRVRELFSLELQLTKYLTSYK